MSRLKLIPFERIAIYFGVVRHFGSKENDSQKNKQRTEQIGVIRNEIKVIIENDLIEWWHCLS
jgi:hypothetical protein